jgi:hypothetical protein
MAVLQGGFLQHYLEECELPGNKAGPAMFIKHCAFGSVDFEDQFSDLRTILKFMMGLCRILQ